MKQTAEPYLATLPYELYIPIASHLAPFCLTPLDESLYAHAAKPNSNRRDLTSRKNLLALCLTCRILHQRTIKLLYSTVVVDDDRLSAIRQLRILLDSLLDHPERRKYVSYTRSGLQWAHQIGDSDSEREFRALFPRNVQALRDPTQSSLNAVRIWLAGFLPRDPVPVQSLLALIMAMCPNLQHLSLGSSATTYSQVGPLTTYLPSSIPLQQLQKLELWGFCVPSGNMENLLSACCTLKSYSLGGDRLDATTLSFLTHCLEHLPRDTLEELTMCFIRPKGDLQSPLSPFCLPDLDHFLRLKTLTLSEDLVLVGGNSSNGIRWPDSLTELRIALPSDIEFLAHYLLGVPKLKRVRVLGGEQWQNTLSWTNLATNLGQQGTVLST